MPGELLRSMAATSLKRKQATGFTDLNLYLIVSRTVYGPVILVN